MCSSALVSGYFSGKAADAQAESAREAMQLQYQMWKQGRTDTAPWREAGKTAVNALSQKINAGPGEYTKSPGYNFRLNEGNKNIERGATASGGLLSGREQKALSRFGQDYATNDYDNFLNRYYNSLTPYQSMAGLGMSAVNTGIGVNTNYANQGSRLIQDVGDAKAGGYINTSNAITSAMKNAMSNALAGYSAFRNSNTSGWGSQMPYPGAPDMSATS